MRRTIIMCLLLGTLVAATPQVYAQDQPSNVPMGKLLYEQGMDLMKVGNYSEACPMLADSDRLDPTLVTKGNLADCYERIGRIASAWEFFEIVAVAYKGQGNTKFADYAQTRADKLRPKLPRLKIVVPSGDVERGLHVERDTKAVEELYWGKEVPVDPGSHTIKATAPGKKAWETSESVAEGKIIVVTIPVLEDLPDPSKTQPPGSGKTTTPAPTNWGHRGTAIGFGVLGVAGLVVGSIAGVSATGKREEALSEHCQNRATNKCDMDGIALGHEADSMSSVSNAMFIGGGVSLAAAGVFLYLSTRSTPAKPATGLIVIPTVSPGHASALVRVQF